nr:hypothetical protein L203_00062 [Cryptococcus depauperatus CBS 7841]
MTSQDHEETSEAINYASKHPESLPQLLSALRNLQVTEPKAIRANVHIYPSSIYARESPDRYRDRRITSWKLNEYMYFKKSDVFPTLARGLFTEKLEEKDAIPPIIEGRREEDRKPKERIVLRGYDKFFNTGEVGWTEWDAMKTHTQGPYYVTLKSNGCLILISAISPVHLVVASKHSLGTTTEERNEATMTVVQPDLQSGAVSDSGPSILSKELRSDIDHQFIERTIKPENTKGCADLHFSEAQNSVKLLDQTLSEMHIQDVPPKKKPTKSEKKAQKLAEKVAHKVQVRAEKVNQSGTMQKMKTGTESPFAEHEEAKQHAEVGRQWLKKTLEKSGKTEQELADRLWRGNMTAVLELCDDSFEEHVLATPDRWTGLHLHGLNANTPHFSTASPLEVTQFAQEFGFIPTKYVEASSLDEVKSFTDDVAKTGSWEGDMIEGFVVRCTVKEAAEKDSGKPPYKIGAPFFFKIKFEEPYLLYRQFREITRAMLPLLSTTEDSQRESVWKTIRAKAKRPEVKVYAEWVERMMKTDPMLFDNYKKGVVKVRERFLEWTRTEGKKWDDARAGRLEEETIKSPREGLPKKWILVPAAVPGCGKTFLGIALNSLYGFAHTQSDDILAKKTAPTFLKNIKELLEQHDVVYADRCNHLVKHYDEIANISNDKKLNKYDVRFIAITWDLDSLPYYQTLRILSDRVVARGDNHQTLRPDTSVDAEHEAVIGRFLREYVPPDPLLFDTIIKTAILDSHQNSLNKVVAGLVQPLHLSLPSLEELNKAIETAKNYRTATPFHSAQKTARSIRYFAVAPEIDLTQLTLDVLKLIQGTDQTTTAWAFLQGLIKRGRVTAQPHVTLCHEKTVNAEKELRGRLGPQVKNGCKQDMDEEEKQANEDAQVQPAGPQEILWETCKEIATYKYPPLFTYSLTHLVWDDRVMAFCLSELHPKTTNILDGNAPSALNVNNILPEETKRLLHITVGTRDPEVPAFESRELIRQVRVCLGQGKEEGQMDEIVQGGGKLRWIKVENMQGEGRIRGMW